MIDSQSVSDLRKENQQLKEKVKLLEKALLEARKQ